MAVTAVAAACPTWAKAGRLTPGLPELAAHMKKRWVRPRSLLAYFSPRMLSRGHTCMLRLVSGSLTTLDPRLDTQHEMFATTPDRTGNAGLRRSQNTEPRPAEKRTPSKILFSLPAQYVPCLCYALLPPRLCLRLVGGSGIARNAASCARPLSRRSPRLHETGRTKRPQSLQMKVKYLLYWRYLWCRRSVHGVER